MVTNRRQESLRRRVIQVQQDALAVAAGIAPPLRWKTGLAIDEDDVRLRTEKGRRTVYEHKDMYGIWTSMGIRADEENHNELALDEVHRRRKADEEIVTGQVDTAFVPLRMIKDRYLQLMHPGPTNCPRKLALHRKREVALERIVGWMGKGATGGDALMTQFRRYLKQRQRQRARPGTANTELVKPSTAAADIRWLNAALNRYNKEKNRGLFISVKGLPRAKRRSFFLDEATYIRLLVSLRRGWIWDEARAGWKVVTYVDEETGQTRQRHYVDPKFAREGYRARFRGRQAQRAVIAAYYTGGRHGSILGLGWEPHPERGWIDTEAGRVFLQGTEPKDDQRPSGVETWDNKRSPTVPMAWQFLILADIWQRADRRIGASHVFQRFGCGGAGYSSLGALLRLIQDAGERIGIQRKLMCVHTLRHTCVTRMLLRNVSIEDVADFVGDSVDVIRKWYRHLGMEKSYAGKHLRPGEKVVTRTPLEALEMREKDRVQATGLGARRRYRLQ